MRIDTISLLGKIEKCEKLPAYPSQKHNVELKIAQILVKLLEDRKRLNRVDVAELLGKSFWKYGFVADALSKTLRCDRSWLVRVCAAESLGIKKYTKGIPDLIQALHDTNRVVRGYSAEALAKMGDFRIITFINERLKRERSSYVKLKLFAALYALGDIKMLLKVVKMLSSRQVYVRNNAVNILLDVACKTNSNIILPYFIKALKNESKPHIAKSLRYGIRRLRASGGIRDGS